MSWGVCCFAAPSEQIQAAVIAGQRPSLNEIDGPDHFKEFAKFWVEKCWNGEPEQRPTFGGEILTSVFRYFIYAVSVNSINFCHINGKPLDCVRGA